MKTNGKGASLIKANATNIPLADKSVDLIVTSPPYFGLRSYQDEDEHYEGQIGAEPTPQDFLEALWIVTKELWRVLKDDGSCFINLGDKRSWSGGSNNSGISSGPTKAHVKNYNKSLEVNGHNMRKKSKMLLPHRYAIGCMDGLADPENLGWLIRNDNILIKPNTTPESAHDRTRDVHEYIFHMTKQEKYYASIDEIREKNVNNSGEEKNPTPTSVWTIPHESLVVPEWLNVDHHAAFPSEIPRKIILGWSPPGICLECDSKRRLIVEKTFIETFRPKTQPKAKKVDLTNPTGDTGGYNNPDYPTGYHKVNIVGVECVCSPAVDGKQNPRNLPPTRPAVVFDPFVGTGTTAMVARILGRYGVGIDLSADYLKIANWRVWSPEQERKVVSKTEAELQESLF